MRIYRCQSCGQFVYFENTQCLHCGTPLGFLPKHFILSGLEPAHGDCWRSLAPQAKGELYRMCKNYTAEQVCNWMVAADSATDFCVACRLNQTIPDLEAAENRLLWRRLEAAKRRLVYSLLRLDLPLVSKQQEPETGLAFAFLADADPSFVENSQVMTGHAQGLITINLSEADDAVRERVRQDMAEPYRTLLGHFRHESGHYYWYRLSHQTGWLREFRKMFGDERQDYTNAMRHNYQQEPLPDWQSRFISRYASAHPWEDWAESWAHYLHITDVLETAWVFRLQVSPVGDQGELMTSSPDFDPYGARSLEPLIEHWLPLTYAVNTLNRSMGQPDLYPFVLAPAVLAKLGFVHSTIRQMSTH